MKYIVNFETYGSQARTLSPEYLLENDNRYVGQYIKTHENGWTISGVVKEDHFYWINEFDASHPKFGKISGNFEKQVTASSKRAYQKFTESFPFSEWDYRDI